MSQVDNPHTKLFWDQLSPSPSHSSLAVRFLLCFALLSVLSTTINSVLQGLVEGDIERTKTMMRQCFPLYTLLLALGSPTVDFLSLDVEVLLCSWKKQNLIYHPITLEQRVLSWRC